MAGFKKFLLLFLISLIAIFIFQNQTSLGEMVQFKLFTFHFSLIMGFWLVMSFITGALLFLSLDLPRSLRQNRELRRRAQELSRLQAEIIRYQTQMGTGGNQPNILPPNQDSENRPRP